VSDVVPGLSTRQVHALREERRRLGVTDHPAIPSWIWTELLAFLDTRADGRFVLTISGGRVVGGESSKKITKPEKIG
jgi:hypothetical protein